jgi:hypothetical protein
MNIQSNIFDLSTEEVETSEAIYNGKVIKCLVAPYHTYAQLEKIVPYTKTTFLFPEREMTTAQLSNFISMVVNMPTTDEIRIITASQNIIIDMVDTSVRILTEGGDVVPCPCKTFMANIHDIRYNILENPNHELSQSQKQHGKDKVNDLITRINNLKGTSVSKADKDKLLIDISMIGEPLIANVLKDMILWL